MVAPLHFPARPPALAQVEVAQADGQSALTVAYASAPLQILAPRPRGPSAWVYTSSFGGGYLAGDQTALEIRVHPGACCFLSTQAMTKVYRNPDRLPCCHRTTAEVAADAVLVFAPDPVQPFANSIYEQRQTWRLSSTAGLALLDWYCAGRSARGENWQFASFSSRNELFLDGKLVWMDSLRLSASDGPLHAAFRTGRYGCFATLALVGPPMREPSQLILRTIAARPLEQRAAIVCSASPLLDGVLLRVAARDVEQAGRELYRFLRPLGNLLGDDPWQRKW